MDRSFASLRRISPSSSTMEDEKGAKGKVRALDVPDETCAGSYASAWVRGWNPSVSASIPYRGRVGHNLCTQQLLRYRGRHERRHRNPYRIEQEWWCRGNDGGRYYRATREADNLAYQYDQHQ